MTSDHASFFAGFYRTLRFRLITMLLACASIVLALSAAHSFIDQKSMLESRLKRDAENIADRLAFTMRQPLWDLNQDHLEQLALQEMNNPSVEAVMVSTRDTPLFLGRERHAADPRIIIPIPAERMKTAGTGTYDIIRPVVYADRQLGSVRVILNDNQTNMMLRQLLLQELLQALTILGGITVLTYLGLSRFLLKPLKELNRATRALGRGDLAARARVGEGDELGMLAATLNSMADRLEQTISELRTREDELQEKNLELELEIDAREQTEQQLRHSEENYRELVEQANSIILRMRTDGTVTFFNEFAEKLFGFSREEIIGRNVIGTIVPANDSSGRNLADMIRTITANPEDHLYNDNENSCKDGSRIWVSWANRPVYAPDGTMEELLCVGQDMTERRMLEQQLVQQQKLESVGLLAGGIAHDFNNLLTPIFVYSEMVRKRLAPDDPAHARITAILEAAGKAKNLVGQLLSFSRKQKLAAEQYDLNGIVEEFAVILRRTIRENIEIRLQLCSDACTLMADRTQLEQILLNLAVNAQDAIEDNGTITIESGHLVLDSEYCQAHPGVRPGQYVMLSFSDSGSGMDAATLNHIFEPFFTTKPVGRGTGLGLSTVYGIIRQHGGHITARSTPGSGTTFSIYLPATLPEEITPRAASAAAPMHHLPTGTILLVEDNRMLLEMAQDLLSNQGHTVIAAASPNEALQTISPGRTRIDLLVSDVVMPGMNGPQLYERLSQHYPDLKVLYISGYASDSIRDDADLEEGVNFLPKPFTSEMLLKMTGELIGQPGPAIQPADMSGEESTP